jgi:hypothetical protein
MALFSCQGLLCCLFTLYKHNILPAVITELVFSAGVSAKLYYYALLYIQQQAWPPLTHPM